MTFFRAVGDSPLFWIFTLLSAVYFFNGLRLAGTAWQRRQEWLGRDTLQPWQEQLAERAAFLLAVPPGVFVHELFHALAVWAFGGRVVDVGYGFYWGYVAPAGTFTAAQNWFISLAGTLGTLLYGFALWLWLRRSRSKPLRYFGLRTLRFHLYYALIYYPLFTLFTFIGDWRTIYDFGATPLLSGVTLAVHLGALGLFWWTDRQGRYEMATFKSEAEQERLATLRRQVSLQPEDTQTQLRFAEALHSSGATREAKQRVEALLDRNPYLAEGHLLLAQMERAGKRRFPAGARRHVEQALQLGLSDPANTAYANAMMGQYYLDVGKVEEAVRYLDDAIAAHPAGGRTEEQGNERAGQNLALLYYLRAVARRRQQKYDAAQRDIREAIGLAEASGREQAVAHYRNEQRTIEHHAQQEWGRRPAG